MVAAIMLSAVPVRAQSQIQADVGPDVNCNLAGLHQGTGPVSTCGNLTIDARVLVNGVDVPAGTVLAVGDIVTVRLTVTPRGGHDAFYQETVDGIRNNNRDLRFAVDVGLPGQTGTELSAPTNVQMSRTDNGDRGNGPLINCLAHNGQEAAAADPLTPVAIGGAPVGATQMHAEVSGSTLTAQWDQLAFDRCVNVLSNNGYYGGQVLSFDQAVTALGSTPTAPTWSLGQVSLERKDGSRSIRWGADSDLALSLPAAPFVPGPTAVADGAVVDASYSGQPATSVVVTPLANDSGSGPLQIVAAGPTSAGGTVSCGAMPASGSCTYTPPVGFAGTDTFTYTVQDDNGSATAQVTVHVAPDAAPDADDDLVHTSLGATASGGVLANDSDSDGDPLAVDTTLLSAPADGTATIAADGTFSYVPNVGFFGTDHFTYRVCGAHSLRSGGTSTRCASATVTVVVDPGVGPEAIPDLVRAEGAASIDVLANDDAGTAGPVTIVSAASGPGSVAGGAVACITTCTYTPPSGFVGVDAFTYTIRDSLGRASSTTVTVEVVGNHPPLAADDVIQATADGPGVTGDLSGNDAEVDGERLRYATQPVSAPAKGSVVIAGDGTFTFTPAAGAVGADSFRYEVCDDHVTLAGASAPACAQADVTITISTRTTSPPVASPDLEVTDTDVAVDIDVLANDRDVDGSPGALTIVSAGGRNDGRTLVGGSVDCANTCTYTPPLGFGGVDAFTYIVRDGDGLEATGLVTVNVVGNQPPVAAADFVMTMKGYAVADHLDRNDLELDGENLLYTADPVVAPMQGTVEIAPDGSYVYQPDPSFTGADEFVYEVCDDHLLLDGTPSPRCSQAVVTILVGLATVDDLPSVDRGHDKPERPVQQPAKPGSSTGGSDRSGLARTGVALGPWAAGAIVSIVVGACFLVVRRRRFIARAGS